MTSYPTPQFTRPALAPGLLGAVVLLVGLLLMGGSGFLYILFAVSILACIIGVFAWQAGKWWWLAGLAPIVVLWNPIWPLPLGGQGWIAAQFLAAVLFIAAGVLIKVLNPEDRNKR
jgi:hypothetical protein